MAGYREKMICTFLSFDALLRNMEELDIGEAPLSLWVNGTDGEGTLEQVEILEIGLAITWKLSGIKTRRLYDRKPH